MTLEISEFDYARARKRLDAAVDEIRSTGAMVNIVEDRGTSLLIQAVYGEAQGGWMKVDALYAITIDGLEVA